MGIFWKTAKVNVTNQSAITTGGPRKALLSVIKPVGYVKNGAWTRIYAVHFKAGNTSADSSTRANEASSLRSTINTTPTTVVGPNFLVGGDTNIYNNSASPYDAAWLRLTESQANNVGRGFDMINMSGAWHNNGANAIYDSQCPCLSCTVTGQSGGGLDDRFDVLISSASLQDGAAMDYVPASYLAFGNDGYHFNNDINGYLGGGDYNLAVPLDVANALHDAADHIPVMVTLQLPAKYGVPSQLSFGRVIVGATPSQTLAVSNAAPAPAATLNYTLAASSGFTAPGGSFSASVGVTNLHALGMDASTLGARSGSVTLSSNDNDTTSKAIVLDGVVLAHAVPSLDSATVVTSTDLDWGTHAPGDFSDHGVTVYDQGYNAGQARLTITGATISGDSRFSLPGVVDPVTFGSPGVGFTIHFDDSSVQADSVYSATLSFATRDESLPGGTSFAPLTVTLHAHVSGSTGVVTPRVLRFDPPSPNPAHADAQLAYDLPHAAHVSLGVYDLSGRLVSRLVEGEVGAGHHAMRWSAQDDAGARVAAGLYFIRFETPGMKRVSRLAILP
jgi:hypothetical protein